MQSPSTMTDQVQPPTTFAQGDTVQVLNDGVWRPGHVIQVLTSSEGRDRFIGRFGDENPTVFDVTLGEQQECRIRKPVAHRCPRFLHSHVNYDEIKRLKPSALVRAGETVWTVVTNDPFECMFLLEDCQGQKATFAYEEIKQMVNVVPKQEIRQVAPTLITAPLAKRRCFGPRPGEQYHNRSDVGQQTDPVVIFGSRDEFKSLIRVVVRQEIGSTIQHEFGKLRKQVRIDLGNIGNDMVSTVNEALYKESTSANNGNHINSIPSVAFANNQLMMPVMQPSPANMVQNTNITMVPVQSVVYSNSSSAVPVYPSPNMTNSINGDFNGSVGFHVQPEEASEAIAVELESPQITPEPESQTGSNHISWTQELPTTKPNATLVQEYQQPTDPQTASTDLLDQLQLANQVSAPNEEIVITDALLEQVRQLVWARQKREVANVGSFAWVLTKTLLPTRAELAGLSLTVAGCKTVWSADELIEKQTPLVQAVIRNSLKHFNMDSDDNGMRHERLNATIKIISHLKDNRKNVRREARKSNWSNQFSTSSSGVFGAQATQLPSQPMDDPSDILLNFSS